MQDLMVLSPSQRTIYTMLVEGKSHASINRALGLRPGILNAQITRIRKYMPIPGDDDYGRQANPAHVSPSDLKPVGDTSRPVGTGASSNEQIVRELSGQALTADQLVELSKKVGGNVARDIHPMILLGITIQFVRMCGGRMIAHQVIEDVYDALKSFVNDGSVQ